jgi:hypothetical protein
MGWADDDLDDSGLAQLHQDGKIHLVDPVDVLCLIPDESLRD